VNDFVDALKFIGDNPGLLAGRAAAQLAIAGAAIGIAMAIALPLGVWLGHIHRGSFIAINISNVGRALPSLAVVAINIALLGLGVINLIVALVILAVPPMLTNAYTAVDGVDSEVVDAARGMGMRPLEVLGRVELPLAIPLLFAGVRTASVYVVATVTLGAVTGTDGGLGDIIANQASYRLAGVLGAAICVAALALLVEGILAGLQWAVTPHGLRTKAPDVVAFDDAYRAAPSVPTAGAMP
jgi:osmoprotectant transport system permease protein